jgi:probable rRNA maturation factor
MKDLIIHLSNQQRDLKLSLKAVRILIRETLALERVPCREISIYFVTQKRISDLHQEYFNDPTPTDCITFPIDDETLGEVFVCPKVALAYCEKNGGDPHTETSLYIVHGILHLLGYDDLEPGKRRTMRKKEKKCMAHLNDLKISLRP